MRRAKTVLSALSMTKRDQVDAVGTDAVERVDGVRIDT